MLFLFMWVLCCLSHITDSNPAMSSFSLVAGYCHVGTAILNWQKAEQKAKSWGVNMTTGTKLNQRKKKLSEKENLSFLL